MFKEILADLLSGMGIGAFISLIPYLAVTKKGISITVLSAANAGSDALQSFWALALCCGAFVLGPILRRYKSRMTAILPSVIVLVSAIYVYISNATLHTISTIILWIATVVLIPIGAIPALISRIIPGISMLGALLISGAFGIGLGFLFEYLPIDFPHFHCFHYSHGGGYSGSYSSSSSYSGSGSNCGSYSSSEAYSDDMDETDSEPSSGASDYYGYRVSPEDSPTDGFGYSVFHDSNGGSLGESRTDSFGYTSYYDENGSKRGESRKDAFGYTVYYDEHGDRRGESREDAFGYTVYYDEKGDRRGESRKDAFGYTQYYDENGNNIGESRTDDYGHTTFYDRK